MLDGVVLIFNNCFPFTFNLFSPEANISGENKSKKISIIVNMIDYFLDRDIVPGYPL